MKDIFIKIHNLIATANDSNYHEILNDIDKLCSAAILDSKYVEHIEDEFEAASDNEEV